MKTTADLKEGIKLMESTDNSMLLDVRSPGEYSEGHLKGRLLWTDLSPRTKLSLYIAEAGQGARERVSSLIKTVMRP